MALAASITLSASRISGIFDVTNLAQSSIIEGAVVQYQTASTDDNDVILPTAANQFNIAGVSMGAGSIPLGTAVSGSDFVAVQKLGRAKVLLTASTTVTRGQQAVVADSTGRTTFRTQWSTSAQVIGYYAQSHTSGSTAEYVMVDLALAPVEICMPVTGFCVTAPGAATKYLVSVNSGAGAASAVPLIVAPFAGTIRNLMASATTAPASTDTLIFAVYRNPLSAGAYGGYATSALTCTITGTAVQAADNTHTVAVTAGDLLAIQCVSSNVTGAGITATFQLT